MQHKRTPPEVSAGSMADIAFLLLIFFLVTASIETDKGLSRLLPQDESIQPIIEIKQKNLFEISLNENDKLLVEGELMNISDLRNSVKAFLDNGGVLAPNDAYCEYCMGMHSPKSSDNPDKAVVSITTNRKTNYAAYVAVQNEVVGAYNELRNRQALKKFGISYSDMIDSYNDNELSDSLKGPLKKKNRIAS